MLRRVIILCIAGMLALVLTGCDINSSSSVPYAPVQISINTKDAFFVHFIPENIGNYMIVNRDGYWLNGKNHLPRTLDVYYGYSGVVIVVDCYNHYTAYDLCCPHCHQQHTAVVVVDGSSAYCPYCDEEYNLAFGLGTPIHNISKEALRRYNTFYSGDRLTVRN